MPIKDIYKDKINEFLFDAKHISPTKALDVLGKKQKAVKDIKTDERFKQNLPAFAESIKLKDLITQ